MYLSVTIRLILALSILSTPTRGQQLDTNKTQAETNQTKPTNVTADQDKLWNDWFPKFGRNDTNNVSERKLILWKNNLLLSGLSDSMSYELEINKFGDLDLADRVHYYTGLRHSKHMLKDLQKARAKAAHKSHVVCFGNKQINKLLQRSSGRHTPRSLDWSNMSSRVLPANDQGMCGVDWAFATTGLLEGKYNYGDRNQQVKFSEQNFIDCIKPSTDCSSGGSAYEALKMAANQGGIMLASDYPYNVNDTRLSPGHCKYNQNNKFKVDFEPVMCVTSPSDNEVLKLVLQSYGPVVVGLHAPNELWFYKEGIFRPLSSCPSDPAHANHEVLLVGYGHSEKYDMDFWILRNSWGQDWGINGFFYMRMGDCGLGYYFTAITSRK